VPQKSQIHNPVRYKTEESEEVCDIQHGDATRLFVQQARHTQQVLLMTSADLAFHSSWHRKQSGGPEY
jgi:hypothetical protein